LRDPAGSGRLVDRLTVFCRLLRARGVRVTPAESIDAVRAIELVDVTDRADVYLALRPLLTMREDDIAMFDELFADWWDSTPGGPGLGSDPTSRTRQPSRPRPSPNRTQDERAAPTLSGWAKSADVAEEESSVSLAAPSTRQSQGAKDFGTFEDADLVALEQLTARLAKRLNARRSRRWRAAYRGQGTRIDLRRTMRLSLDLGGDLLELARRERKLRRTKVIALCDVSGSMDLYSRFLLQFLYALQHAFARVETYAFSTRLVRITDALARGSYREALDELARSESGWSGGTKIGASIAEFVAASLRRVDRRTVVIVLSDGWDTGEPEIVSEALAAIHRRAGRVVWLNPLLGSPTYQPLTRGMQAALPHVDIFAAAHNLASLEQLARHLRL
jgi:uncharacterized protein with von Willebrand factor type A (vWA) domain